MTRLGPRGDPILAPLVCLYNLLFSINIPCVAINIIFQKISIFIGDFASFLKLQSNPVNCISDNRIIRFNTLKL